MPPPDSRPGQFRPTSDQFLAKQQVEEPTSQDLIEMAATQCLKESTGETMGVTRKINTQLFSQMKFQDNKKRQRPGTVKDPAAASDANATGNVMMEDESMGEQTQNKGTSNPFSFGKGGKQ